MSSLSIIIHLVIFNKSKKKTDIVNNGMSTITLKFLARKDQMCILKRMNWDKRGKKTLFIPQWSHFLNGHKYHCFPPKRWNCALDKLMVLRDLSFTGGGGGSVSDGRSPIFSGPPIAYVKKFWSPPLAPRKNFGLPRWKNIPSHKQWRWQWLD